MRALKIVAEGMVTSFRYPYFVQGVHPTFEMPPPATIYGHVCSAVGDYLPYERRSAIRFAYHFTYESRFQDYEHLWFFPNNKGMPNPAVRELLFRPRLTLYLDDLNLEPYFRTPHYAVTLGRGQDLMTYTSVEVIDLQQVDQCFFEYTIMPLDEATRFGSYAYSVVMPRYIDERRQVKMGRYGVITTPVEYPNTDGLQFEGGLSQPIVVDPNETNTVSGLSRGVFWHDWNI